MINVLGFKTLWVVKCLVTRPICPMWLPYGNERSFANLLHLSHFLEKLGKLFEGFSLIMQFLDIELYSPSFHYSSTYPYAFFHPSCKFYSCLPIGMCPFHYIFIHYVTSLTIFLGKWGLFSYFHQVCNFPQGSSPHASLQKFLVFHPLCKFPKCLLWKCG